MNLRERVANARAREVMVPLGVGIITGLVTTGAAVWLSIVFLGPES